MGEAQQAFAGELERLEQEIAHLDTSLNADLVARFEMTTAVKFLYVYVSRGDRAVLHTAEERLRRVAVMVPLWMRERVSETIDNLVLAGGELAQREREELAADWPSRMVLPLDGANPVDAVVQIEKESMSQPPISVGWSVEEAVFNDAIERVRGILRRLPIGLERWPWEKKGASEGLRWPVEKESHVQSLLWLALAPSLPGLKYEETLPSIGRTQPRVDLALPSVGLAIEAKFLRSEQDFRRVTEEIAADSALYTRPERATYSRLIVFSWDDTRSSERHQVLEEGLKRFRGVIDAITVSRPGRMNEP